VIRYPEEIAARKVWLSSLLLLLLLLLSDEKENKATFQNACAEKKAMLLIFLEPRSRLGLVAYANAHAQSLIERSLQ